MRRPGVEGSGLCVVGPLVGSGDHNNTDPNIGEKPR